MHLTTNQSSSGEKINQRSPLKNSTGWTGSTIVGSSDRVLQRAARLSEAEHCGASSGAAGGNGDLQVLEFELTR